MPVAEKPQMEKIVDQRIGKKTRRKNYFEHLIKWKRHESKMPVGKMKILSRRRKNQ
jgi:hypothetical protein